MKLLTPAFVLYIISGLTFVISSMLGYENVIFVSKPMIASSIIFHYINEVKFKVNYWHLLFLFSYFLSGVLNLFEDNQTLVYVLSLNMLAYSVLQSFIVKKMFSINYKNIDNVNLLYIILTLIFLGTLVYLCLGLIFTKENEMYSYFVLYSIILASLVISSTILYTLKHSNAIVYLLLAAFCYLICDLFYIIYYYYYNFIFFRLLSILSSVLSYYFVVNYFLKSNETTEVVE